MKYKELLFGCGKAKIDFSGIGFPYYGFSGIDDDLYARSFIFKSNQLILMISVELPSLNTEAVSRLKKEICKKYEMQEYCVWIGVTHTFCAPHVTSKYKGVYEMVSTAIFESVNAAIKNCQEACLGYITMNSSININRNVDTPFGWWLGHNPKEYSNKQARILKIVAAKSNETLGILINYDIQSAIMDQVQNSHQQLQITSDLMGKVCSKMEKFYDQKVVTMFLLGAAGDQAPISQGRKTIITNNGLQYQYEYEKGRDILDQLSTRFMDTLLAKINTAEIVKTREIQVLCRVAECNEKVMPLQTKEMKPSLFYDFSLTGRKLEIEIEGILLGEVLLLGTKVELNSSFGKQIMDALPIKRIMLCTMINGAKKYLPQQLDYKRVTYVAMNSSFGEGSSESFYNTVLELYKEIEKRNGNKANIRKDNDVDIEP